MGNDSIQQEIDGLNLAAALMSRPDRAEDVTAEGVLSIVAALNRAQLRYEVLIAEREWALAELGVVCDDGAKLVDAIRAANGTLAQRRRP